MKCVDEGLLALYVEGDLRPKKSAKIERHVETCRACNARKHLITEDEFRARLAAERLRSADDGSPEQVQEERPEQ